MATAGEVQVDGAAGRRRPAEVEIVIPVYNEEADLETSVSCLHEYLASRFPFSWVITIADNASPTARGASPAAWPASSTG